MSLVVASGCGWRHGGEGLKGSVPRGPAFVGDVTLPELHPGRPDKTFRLRAPPGHLLFVYFGYTNCPDICPTTLSDLRNALRRIGSASERVDAAFVTVDLYRDSASVVVPYLATFVKHGHALRPQSQPELGAAEKAFGATSTITKQPSGEFEVDHTATSYIVDEGGHILVQWDFGMSPENMAHDLRVLLAQTGRGASG